DRGAGQARLEITAGRRHRRPASPRVQPGRQARRRMPPPGIHAHAAGVIRPMRSLLFVPGDSPKKLEKGAASDADALIVDLEDSVAPDRKAAARTTTRGFLNEMTKAP